MSIELDDIPATPSRPRVRMTRFEGHPAAVEQAMQLVADVLVPLQRSSEGWQRAVGLRSFDGRQGILLSFWEDHDALIGSEATTVELRKRAASAGLDIDIDRLEVLFDEQ